MRKKMVLYSIGSLIGLIVAFFLFILFVVWFILHPTRASSSTTPTDYQLTYETVHFRNAVDNTQLEGWWIPAQDEFFQKKRTRNTIIFAHGFGDSRSDMPINALALAKRFAYEGYNVLLFDFRNSGNSQGKLTTIGYYETYDVLAAITFAQSKGSDQIGLLGWSMGATSSILAAQNTPNVKAVVADSPFSDFHTYIAEQFSYWTHLPNSFSPLVIKTAEMLLGIDYTKVSPVNAVEELKKTDTAMLLIHGKKDQAVSYQNSLAIQRKMPQAELWLIQNTGHIRGYKNMKNQYEEKVVEFFQQHLQQQEPEYWAM